VKDAIREKARGKNEVTFSKKSSPNIQLLKGGVLRALSTPAHKYTDPLHKNAGGLSLYINIHNPLFFDTHDCVGRFFSKDKAVITHELTKADILPVCLIDILIPHSIIF
jgi:hypothetical protein